MRYNMRKHTCYFAHSRVDYGTLREKGVLDNIRHVFSCKVINPGNPTFLRKMEGIIDRYTPANEYIRPFLELINSCDCLIFMAQESDKTGIGTFLEVRHAESIGMPVYVWDGIKFTTQYRLDECHNRSGKRDYKSNWAKVTIING